MTPALLLLALLSSPQHSQASKVSPFREDLRTIVRTIDSLHPWPWRRIPTDSFHRMAARLERQIDRMPPEQAAVRMMQLVASLHDGHTELKPSGQPAFTRWFPVRFHRFADSLAITAADSSHGFLVGARVLTIGKRPALEAQEMVASLSGADNAWGRRERTGLMSSAAALKGLGLSDGQKLELQLRLADGTAQRVTLTTATTEWGDPAWMQRGEMFGPAGIPVVTAFEHLTSLQYRERRPSLPLSLRNRVPIWFTWLPQDSTLYMQSNFVQDFGALKFAAIIDSAFAAADTAPVRRFILDLRYNSGGDGSKVMAFVHGIIRRPRLDQPGRLVLLTGAKSFSAAVLWLSALREHTNVVTVGEPAGAARNHSGDAIELVLPRTGMTLQVSVLRHYGTRSDDPNDWEMPDFPIPSLAGDYFAGRDVALEFARSTRDLRSLPKIALESGSAAALAEYTRRQARFGRVTGWHAFDEREMNSAGYTAREEGRVEQALAIFAWNTKAYPCSGNAWDSWGEALLAAGDSAKGAASYRRAAELDPGNSGAREIADRWAPRPWAALPAVERECIAGPRTQR